MKNGPYTLVIAPAGYPGRKYRGRYVYEHHLVWWLNTGQLLPDGYVLHHKDENKTNNLITNLCLASRSDHSRTHYSGGTAAYLSLYCSLCQFPFMRTATKVRTKLKQGQSRFFCCRSHQVKYQRREQLRERVSNPQDTLNRRA